MNTTQRGNTKPGRTPSRPDQNRSDQTPSPSEDDGQSAEEVRHGSQTAQDREHTIRRGDNVTTQTKEFPS